MQHKYRSRVLVTIDNEHFMVNIYKYEKCKFEEAFLILKPGKIFARKRRICKMTKMSGGCDSSNFDGNTISVGGDDMDYMFISGFEIIKFSTEDYIMNFITLLGYDMIPTAIAIGKCKHISYLTSTNL